MDLGRHDGLLYSIVQWFFKGNIDMYRYAIKAGHIEGDVQFLIIKPLYIGLDIYKGPATKAYGVVFPNLIGSMGYIQFEICPISNVVCKNIFLSDRLPIAYIHLISGPVRTDYYQRNIAIKSFRNGRIII